MTLSWHYSLQKDRLRVSLQIENGVGQASLPPMLLQTLAKNAIKHGLQEAIDGVELVVRAERGGDALQLEVENRGTLGEARTDSTQIGLANTRERLRLL